ncbi:MAG: FliO/MopB family protein [Gammaproteobacteria bacterium]
MAWRLLLLPFAAINLWHPVWAQTVGDSAVVPELGTGYLVRVTLGLLVVLVSILAAAWLLGSVSRFQTGTDGPFRVLSAISIGPRERIVLLQVGDCQLLVSVAPGRIQTLHVLERPIDMVSVPARSSSGFSSLLSAALKRGRHA